ncbi:MAG: chemotaxis protein CheA, partial [Massilia sp.]
GATILGDGGVSLILDVPALMRATRQDEAVLS